MPTKKQERVLPPDVFDYLELSALAFGGIGGTYLFDRDEVDSAVVAPVCAYGHAYFAAAESPEHAWDTDVTLALEEVGIFVDTNDRAVERINKRRDRAPDARVTFKQWARELGVVRGEG